MMSLWVWLHDFVLFGMQRRSQMKHLLLVWVHQLGSPVQKEGRVGQENW